MPSIDNKKKSQQNKILYIFLTAFFVSLIIIIYIATAFTPDIDVDINSGNEYASDANRKEIDDRLRDLQQDEMVSDSESQESSSEIIAQLKKLKEDAIEKQQQNDEAAIESEKNTAPETPKLNPANPEYKPQKDALPRTAKIYVGRYATFDEALKVQDALIQSQLVSSPFIKSVGGHYVIQVGSYSNQQTAQNIAENLIENGYSARMILE